MLRSLAATLTAAALTVALAPAAGAQQSSPTELIDGGRLPGASSQLAPTGFSPNPLPEFGGTVDLGRYAGTWYQVAAIPQPFTLQCVSDVTAEYAVIDQDTISVRNSCGTPWGDRSSIEGTADVRSAASLRVNFGGIPFQERQISEAEVAHADELMLTSATKEVLPVTRYNGEPVGDGRPGPIYARLRIAYDAAIAANE